MADLSNSLDEILTELGDSFDADIAASNRKIVRSTANKIWLMLRAFSRGLYGIYQIVAALQYRFDPIYCSEDDLESTMRITGTSRYAGKASLLTVTIWNNHDTLEKTLPIDTYNYLSANGITFSLVLQDAVVIPANSFVKRDFFSSLGGAAYIGSYPVSTNTDLIITNATETLLDEYISFDCEDNADQLGYAEETLFEVRQRILTDNQRQEILHILEERLKDLANVHECTVIGNNSLAPINSPYLADDGITYVLIEPQSVLVILTGSPTADFAETFLSLCPFVTTQPVNVADIKTVYYYTDIYVDGRFPIHYLPHRIANYNVIVKYGYIARQVTTAAIEQAMTKLLQTFKARTKYEDLISTEDFTDALSVYQNPAVKLLSITFTYNGTNVDYMLFDKTQIARLNTISYQQVSL